jgi:hypothetical protein
MPSSQTSSTLTARRQAATDVELDTLAFVASELAGSTVIDGFTPAAVEALKTLPARDADTAIKRYRAAYSRELAELDGQVVPINPARRTFQQGLLVLAAGELPKPIK